MGTDGPLYANPPAGLAANAIPRFGCWSQALLNPNVPLPTNIFFTNAFLPQPPGGSSGSPSLIPNQQGQGSYIQPFTQYPYVIRLEAVGQPAVNQFLTPGTLTARGLTIDYAPDPSTLGSMLNTYYETNPQYAGSTLRGQFALRCQEGVGAHVITAFDELSLTVQWTAGAGTMTSPIVQGTPALTMVYAGLTPVIDSLWLPIWKVNYVAVSTTGTVTLPAAQIFTVFYGQSATDPNGFTLIVWFSSSVSLQIVVPAQPGGGWMHPYLSLAAPYTGTVRVAIQDANSASDVIYMLSQETYATGTTVNYGIGATGATGQMTITFTPFVAGSPMTLCGLIHQAPTLGGYAASPLKYYAGINGAMTCVTQDTWTFSYALPPLTFGAPDQWDAVSSSRQHDTCTAALEWEMNQMAILAYPTDSYGFGKAIAKAAQLLMVASECARVGESVSQSTMSALIAAAEAAFTPWLDTTGDATSTLCFEPNYRGLTTLSGLVYDAATQSFPNDFGAGIWNDFIIHSGYMMYAAAVIGHVDSTWLGCASAVCQGRVAALRHLARNLANPSSADQTYTTTRYKEVFTGHSWLSGFVLYADGKNMESSSEVMNAYYGLALLGSTLNDTNMEGLGQLLLEQEIESINIYYRSWSGSNIYSYFTENQGYAPGSSLITNRFSTKLSNQNFFTCGPDPNAAPICANEMQLMPYTAITPRYLSPMLAAAQWPNVSSFLSPAFDRAFGFNNLRGDLESGALVSWAVRLVNNLGTAYQDLGFAFALHGVNATTMALDIGDSQTNALYYIATLPVKSHATVFLAGWILMGVASLELIVLSVLAYRRCRAGASHVPKSKRGYVPVNGP